MAKRWIVDYIFQEDTRQAGLDVADSDRYALDRTALPAQAYPNATGAEMIDLSYRLDPETIKREFAFQLARALEVDPERVYGALNFSLDLCAEKDLLLKVECHGACAESRFPSSALTLSLDDFSNTYLMPLIYVRH